MGRIVLSRRRWPSILLRGFVVLAGLLALYFLHLAKPRTDYFVDRTGSVVAVEAEPEEQTAEWIAQDVSLTSDSGLLVNMRTRRPVADGQVPVAILIGGERTGRRAVDLVEDLAGIAYAAIDYPFDGDRDIRGVIDGLTTLPAIQRAFLDAPPALMLASEWLVSQPWVDSERIEMVGVSLGVPFAAAAGAMDPNVQRVWLIHGGLDNVSWLDHALKPRIESDFFRKALARLGNLLIYGHSFHTPTWIERTSPRPVVLIAAREDERVPEDDAHPLQAITALDHVELKWTEGRHIGPRRMHELQQLIAIVQTAINKTGD